MTAQRKLGLDIDMRGCGKLEFRLEQALIEAAQGLDLARLSNHGITSSNAALLKSPVAAPASAAARRLLAGHVGGRENFDLGAISEALRGAKMAPTCSRARHIRLELAEQAEVYCAEDDPAALNAACARARHQGAANLKGEARDLFTRPLLPAELEKFDAVVFDPPRAGAEAQARELAKLRGENRGCILQSADFCARRQDLIGGRLYAGKRHAS